MVSAKSHPDSISNQIRAAKSLQPQPQPQLQPQPAFIPAGAEIAFNIFSNSSTGGVALRAGPEAAPPKPGSPAAAAARRGNRGATLPPAGAGWQVSTDGTHPGQPWAQQHHAA